MTRSQSVLVALAKQYGLPLATAQNRILRPDTHQELEKLIPAAFARRHRVLPLFLDRETLAVALAEPSEEALRALRALTRCELQPFLAREAELNAALERFYGRDR